MTGESDREYSLEWTFRSIVRRTHSRALSGLEIQEHCLAIRRNQGKIKPPRIKEGTGSRKAGSAGVGYRRRKPLSTG